MKIEYFLLFIAGILIQGFNLHFIWDIFLVLMALTIEVELPEGLLKK